MSVATWSPDLLHQVDKIPRRVVSPPKQPFLAEEKRPPQNGLYKSHPKETWSITPVTTWSPDLLRSGERMPRRIVTIPRDQQLLLDRPDAWSRRGIPNVPPSVLEGVKKFHTLKQAAEPVRPSTEHQQTDNDSDSDEEGTEISWESSPSEHLHGPALAKASKDLVNRVVAHSSPTPSRKKNLLNSEPEPARVPRNVQTRFSLPLNQPMSSLASADDALEVEVPKAVAPPSRNTAREACGMPLEPTPPSAQVIPSTYTEVTQENPPNPPPQPPRQRLMKDPNNAWSKPMPSVLTSPAVVSTRAPALDQSGSGSIPGNLSGNARPAATLAAAKGGATSLPPLGHVAPSVPSIEETTHETRSSGSERIPPNGPASQVPYTTFRLAYPDFQASKNDFIRALLCLKQIRKNKSIARFLYDDFVRVFCRDYMHYITLDNENQETLTPAKWYNENVQQPRYLKSLLTPENLQEALDQYPSEAEYLRNQAKGQASLKKDVNAKALAPTPIEKERVTPKTEKSIPKPAPIISTAPESTPQQGRSPMEITSDSIDLTRPAEKSVLGPSTANSGSTSASARTYSVFKTAVPLPSSPEFIPLSPSTKENEPPNRPEPENRSRPSTGGQPPSFKVHPLAPLRPPPPPAQASKESQHQHRVQEPPVAVYGKKHSLPADLLRSTDVPLSQQSNAERRAEPSKRKHPLPADPSKNTDVPPSQRSNAESIAEPKRKKRRANRDADGADLGFARFLRSLSSTPGPVTAPSGGT